MGEIVALQELLGMMGGTGIGEQVNCWREQRIMGNTGNCGSEKNGERNKESWER